MEIKPFDPSDELVKEDEKCKGLTFRGHSSQFFHCDRGRIEKRERLQLLRRESCPGCLLCSWFFDDMHDVMSTDDLVWPEKIEEGKLYTIKAVNIHTDWETGGVEDFQFEIVEKK